MLEHQVYKINICNNYHTLNINCTIYTDLHKSVKTMDIKFVTAFEREIDFSINPMYKTLLYKKNVQR